MPGTLKFKDPLAAIVDVAAINQYFGWYYSGFLASAANLDPLQARKVMLANMDKIKFHVPNDKPFIFSELGAGAKRGMQGKEGPIRNFFRGLPSLGLPKANRIDPEPTWLGRDGTLDLKRL